MALIDEGFIRCPKCNHPYFIDVRQMAIAKEPAREDMERIEPTYTRVKYLYQCASCGEQLNRFVVARQYEAANRPPAPTKRLRAPQDEERKPN